MSPLTDDSKFLARELRAEPPPNAGHPVRKRLGEILVDNGLVTCHTVERLLPLCAKAGRRLGNILEDLSLITSAELAGALSVQYGCRTVSDFARYSFSDKVLQLIPVETAVEHTLFPLKVKGNTLALAVFDPTKEAIIQNIRENSGMEVVPFVATRSDINAAISKHYLKQEATQGGERTVLVVDDDKLVLQVVSQMLTEDGYEVIRACDGMEAYKALVSKSPKVVITDKEMPKFNGYALLDSLKAIPETQKIPVILMASSNDSEEEAKAYERGFFDYLQKPVKETILRAKVKRALRSYSHVVYVH